MDKESCEEWYARQELIEAWKQGHLDPADPLWGTEARLKRQADQPQGPDVKRLLRRAKRGIL